MTTGLKVVLLSWAVYVAVDWLAERVPFEKIGLEGL
jgi:hypothetical protein